MRYFLFAILLLYSIQSPAASIPPANPQFQQTSQCPLSIPQLIDIALQNNPETRTAWWYAQRAAASKGIAESSYYPSLYFDGSVWHGRDYKFPNGDETTYTSTKAAIALTYLLFDFGERSADNEAAKAALIAADWQSNWILQNLVLEVLNNAYAYLNAQEILISRQASLDDANATLEAVEELHRAGLRSITDVYTIRATVSDTQIGIARQQAEVDITQSRLAVSLGFDADSPIQVIPLPDPASLPQAQKCGTSVNDLIEIAHEQRADLMAKRADLAQKQSLQDKARAQYLPKLEFAGDGGIKKYFHDRSNGYEYNVGLNLICPLYTGGESTYQKKLADANMQMTLTELEKMELKIAQEVLMYSRRFQAAQEIVLLSCEYLENSIKSFQGTLDRYKAGTQSIFDLAIAQRVLAEARIKHGEAKTAWYRNLAELALAIGTISSEVSCQNTP